MCTTATGSRESLTLQWLAHGMFHAERYHNGGSRPRVVARYSNRSHENVGSKADVRGSRTRGSEWLIVPAKMLADPEKAQWHSRDFVSVHDTKAGSRPRIKYISPGAMNCFAPHSPFAALSLRSLSLL